MAACPKNGCHPGGSEPSYGCNGPKVRAILPAAAATAAQAVSGPAALGRFFTDFRAQRARRGRTPGTCVRPCHAGFAPQPPIEPWRPVEPWRPMEPCRPCAGPAHAHGTCGSPSSAMPVTRWARRPSPLRSGAACSPVRPPLHAVSGLAPLPSSRLLGYGGPRSATGVCVARGSYEWQGVAGPMCCAMASCNCSSSVRA